MTAGVLWVKKTFLSACQQTKWRPDRTKFDGEIVSQTRVPPVSTPMNNLFSTPRVKNTNKYFTCRGSLNVWLYSGWSLQYIIFVCVWKIEVENL